MHGALVGETLVVGDVPVEDVHLVVRHGVEHLLDDVDGEVVPRRVQKEAAVGEAGEVVDVGLVDDELRRRASQ